MAFTPPKRDIVEMMTPQKEPTSTAITPYKENKKFIRFCNGRNTTKTKNRTRHKRTKKK